MYACVIVKYPFWKKLQNLEGGGGFCVLLSSSTLKIPFIYPSSLIVSFDMQPSNVLQIRQVVDTNEFTTKVKIVEKVIEVFKHRQPWILVSECISAEGSFLYPILTFEQHLQVLIVLQVVFQFLLQNMMTS